MISWVLPKLEIQDQCTKNAFVEGILFEMKLLQDKTGLQCWVWHTWQYWYNFKQHC